MQYSTCKKHLNLKHNRVWQTLNQVQLSFSTPLWDLHNTVCLKFFAERFPFQLQKCNRVRDKTTEKHGHSSYTSFNQTPARPSKTKVQQCQVLRSSLFELTKALGGVEFRSFEKPDTDPIEILQSPSSHHFFKLFSARETGSVKIVRLCPRFFLHGALVSFQSRRRPRFDPQVCICLYDGADCAETWSMHSVHFCLQGSLFHRRGRVSVPVTPSDRAHHLCVDLQVSPRAAVPSSSAAKQNQRPPSLHFLDSLYYLVAFLSLQHHGWPISREGERAKEQNPVYFPWRRVLFL